LKNLVIISTSYVMFDIRALPCSRAGDSAAPGLLIRCNGDGWVEAGQMIFSRTKEMKKNKGG
jgi:hypothetical protein